VWPKKIKSLEITFFSGREMIFKLLNKKYEPSNIKARANERNMKTLSFRTKKNEKTIKNIGK
jgi:hypothetical protein